MRINIENTYFKATSKMFKGVFQCSELKDIESNNKRLSIDINKGGVKMSKRGDKVIATTHFNDGFIHQILVTKSICMDTLQSIPFDNPVRRAIQEALSILSINTTKDLLDL